MTAVGRGRGWGKYADNYRRPGQNVAPIVVENDEWFKRINKIDINDADIKETIKSSKSPIADFIITGAPEEEIARLNQFCEFALDDRTFALKLILTFTHSSNYLPLFMGSLQLVYNQRDSLKEKNPVRCLNLMYLIGETYYRTRTMSKFTDDNPLRCLQIPSVVCLRMLLEIGGDDEIQLATTHTILNGKSLFKSSTKGLPEVFIYAREQLATRNLSTRSRCMLLLMIDLYNQNFMPLSSDLQEFYVNQLGQSTLLEMQRDTENILVINNCESQDNDIEKGSNEPGILMPPKSRKNNVKNFPRRSGASGGRPMSSVPRAIRGSGAGDIGEQIKSRNFDPQRSHPNEGNKGYGHDDRFNKDY